MAGFGIAQLAGAAVAVGAVRLPYPNAAEVAGELAATGGTDPAARRASSEGTS